MTKKASAKKLLAAYRAKRDFKKTAEPSGDKAVRSGKNSYLIQKHAARRLHYDFRLELNGVLKSWAITRGPSLNPADKRLAVHVEDHPLDYGGFEGTIPQGQYGGGTVMLWDKGDWEPIGDAERAYKKGDLAFDLHGKRLQGRWHLVRMRHKAREGKHENWLLIKGKDEFANEKNGDAALEKYTTSVTTDRDMAGIAAGTKSWESGKVKTRRKSKAAPKPANKKPRLLAASADLSNRGRAPLSRDGGRRAKMKKPARAAGHASTRKQRSSPLPSSKMPGFREPQLATLTTTMPKGADWIYEIKFDGYRMVTYIDSGKAAMFSRNGKDWTAKFGPIADLLGSFSVENAIIDGEVVVPDPQGHSNFSALKDALFAGDVEKFQYYVFDIMFLDGKDLTRLPLLERKNILEGLVRSNKTKATQHKIIYSEHFTNQTDEFLHNVCSLHLEGIMSKRADAPYSSGRTKVWLKTKCHLRQEFVIGGFTLSKTGGSGIGSLLLGYYDKDELIYSGRVGTGFDDEMSMKLRRMLEKLKQKKMSYQAVPTDGRRGAIWVEPKLVGEVEFSEWTPDGNLRHPSFQGLREDKRASVIVREVPVATKVATVEAEEEVAHQKQAALKSANNRGAASIPASLSPAKGSRNIKVDVGGIAISHATRIIYPGTNITKLHLAEYYLAVASKMMPYVKDRPLSVLRCPEGTGDACFFQRHVGLGKSPHVHEVGIKVKQTDRNYLSIHDQKGLLSLTQWGVIEFHPWQCSIRNLDKPDQIIFDLDPDPAVSWTALMAGAFDVRDRLKQIGLKTFLKTTGGKGLHIVIPIRPLYEWATIKEFAHGVATIMAEDRPDLYIAKMSKAARKGKIFIDYLRNDVTSTAVAPYSVRAREGATVSTPLDWKELVPSLSLSDFTIHTVLQRLKKLKKDPWQDFEKTRQVIPKQFLKVG